MASIDSDPIEFTGDKPEIIADPKPPKVAVYIPPAADEAHPKVARKSVASALDLAEANLHAATLEVTAAKAALNVAQMNETNAHQAFLETIPAPSYEEINRARLDSIQADRAARVAQGLPPEPVIKPVVNRSPLDVAAANRQRMSPAAPSYPLRSPVTRR